METLAASNLTQMLFSDVLNSPFASATTIPLSQCQQGESVTVAGFEGDGDMQSRLEAVGVFIGREFTVFRTGALSGTIVDSTDMRLALDSQLTGKILVQRGS